MKLLKNLLIVVLLFNATRLFGQYDFVDPDYQPPCGEKIHLEKSHLSRKSYLGEKNLLSGTFTSLGNVTSAQ